MTQTYNLRHLGEWGRNVIPGQPGQKVQGIPQEIPLQPTKPRYDDTVLLSRLFGVVNRKTLLQVSLIIEVRCNSQTAKAIVPATQALSPEFKPQYHQYYTKSCKNIWLYITYI
jgi:hypothetical protein